MGLDVKRVEDRRELLEAPPGQARQEPRRRRHHGARGRGESDEAPRAAEGVAGAGHEVRQVAGQGHSLRNAQDDRTDRQQLMRKTNNQLPRRFVSESDSKIIRIRPLRLWLYFSESWPSDSVGYLAFQLRIWSVYNRTLNATKHSN